MESRHLAMVKEILQDVDATVFIFGSRINGNASAASDLDLCLKTDLPMSLAVISELREKFQESNLPFKVDLCEFRLLPEDFQRQILARGIQIK